MRKSNCKLPIQQATITKQATTTQQATISQQEKNYIMTSTVLLTLFILKILASTDKKTDYCTFFFYRIHFKYHSQ